MKVNVDGYGSESDSADVDVKSSFNLALEFDKAIANGFSLGGGIGYVTAPEAKDGGVSLDINWIPVYGLAKYSSPINEKTSLYGLVQLGYGIAQYGSDWDETDTKQGGIYFGLGAGLKISNIIAEVVYSQTRAHMEEKGTDVSYGYTYTYTAESDITYPKVSLNLGVCF